MNYSEFPDSSNLMEARAYVIPINDDRITGRDGEIRQLNSLRVYGKFVVRADGLSRSWAFFTVSTIETVAGGSNVKTLCIIIGRKGLILTCSHRLQWLRPWYECQICHRLHRFEAMNARFQKVWTCFRFDRICFCERAQYLTSIRRYRAMRRQLSYFPRALKVRWPFAQRGPKWNGEWSTAEKWRWTSLWRIWIYLNSKEKRHMSR